MATTASRSIVFTPANLLDGEWEAAGLRSEEEVARALHEGLLYLRCREAEVELELGRGLKRFLREGDASYRMLSHSNAEDACSMRLGFSAAHARDLMEISAGVERVPELGEAFVAARIGRSKLRVVMEVATPETAESWVRWSRHQGVRKLGAAATEGACVVEALRQMIKDLVPPRRLLRRQLGRNLKVLERDGWRCSNPMCRARSRLHVHHIVFRSHGGSDEPSNLITICISCHALVHSGRLRITGRAPDQVLFSTPIGELWREGLRVAA